MKLKIRDSISEDAVSLGSRLREADLREIKAGVITSPSESLLQAIDISQVCKTVVDDTGTVICMFGVTPSLQNSHEGMPWLLSSPDIKDHIFQFLRESKEWIDTFHDTYPVLWTLCHAQNTLHHRWLEWSGFDIKGTYTMGDKQEEFFCFVKIKEAA